MNHNKRNEILAVEMLNNNLTNVGWNTILIVLLPLLYNCNSNKEQKDSTLNDFSLPRDFREKDTSLDKEISIDQPHEEKTNLDCCAYKKDVEPADFNDVNDGLSEKGALDKNFCVHPPVVKKLVNSWAIIPGGCFYMGSTKNEKCRWPDETLHEVILTNDIEIFPVEVPQNYFQIEMGYNPSKSSCGFCPVENVNWHEAAAYCNKLSKNKKLTNCYMCIGKKSNVLCSEKSIYSGKDIYKCSGYRLPTEAEWEYAYRSGTSSPYYNGKNISCNTKDSNADKISWYHWNAWYYGSPQKGGYIKTPNAWGLYDMAGNVWEWCHDWYIKDLGSKPTINPFGGKVGKERVLRGGSWWSYPTTLRAASRFHDFPIIRNDKIGFRCLRTINP